MEVTAISESLARINEIKGRNFSIFSDSRSMTAAISSSKKLKKSPCISRIKEQFQKKKAAGKHVEVHWIIEGLPGTRKPTDQPA
jgi:ribonuclease HI